MKSAINLLSIAVLIVAGIFLLSQFAAINAPGVATPQLSYPGFPQFKSQTIEFDAYEDEAAGNVQFKNASYWNGYSQRSTGQREHRDQSLDWLLMTAISGSNLPETEVNKILFDLPPIRRGQLSTIANFEFGATRSRVLSDDHVLALIPAGSEESKRENLAHIADEERKNIGKIPAVFDVFVYQMDASGNSAALTRVAPVPYNNLFSETAGYFERDIRTLKDFQSFMSAVNDITMARNENGVLRLGGRRVESYRGIRVEDVAAIWKSENALGGNLRGSGFSLDPEFDFEKLRRQSIMARLIALIEGGSDDEALSAETALENKDIDGYRRAMSQVCERSAESQQCLAKARNFLMENRFQKARYDGQLQGTEVGMVLFYTDLLMKLWSLDYQDSTPRAGQVSDFPNELQMQVASVYKDEVDRFPETRLWLGSLDKGFQIGKGRQEVLLARNATRVFAVPHDSIENRDQTESADPHIYDRIFMTWWNQHYEEVACYEQAYQQLNEIMKWSQIIGWLNSASNGNMLGFLSGVPVVDTNYFPGWARKHTELTFRRWNQVPFYPRRYHGSTTEALPILSSRGFKYFGRSFHASGGVSLAEREAIAARSEISETVSALNRRANLDYSASLENKLRTLEKTEYEFESQPSRQASMVARPAADRPLRSLIGEFRSEQFERALMRDASGLTISERSAAGAVGDLRIARFGEGFRVGWVSRDIDAGQSLARRLSLSPDFESVLAKDNAVEAYLKLDGAQGYLVKPRGSEGWMKVAPSTSQTETLAAGFQARISGPGSQAREIDVAWLSKDLREQIPEGSYIKLENAAAQNSPARMTYAARPPPNAKRVEIEYQGRRWTAYVDDGNRTYVRWGDVPDELRSAPERLHAATLRQGASAPDYAPIIRDFETADYSDAAGRLARDPKAYRAALDNQLTEELQNYERLVSQQKLAEAHQRLDYLLDIHGNRPELVLRRALEEIGDGKPDSALKLFEEAGGKNPDRFYAEIDERIANGLFTPQDARSLREFRAYAEIEQQQMLTKNALLQQYYGSMDNGHFTLWWKDAKLAAEPSSVEAVIEHPAPIYIQDTPGLNHLDFNPAVSPERLRSLVTNGKISIERVQSAELATYRPSMVLERGTQTKLKLAEPAGWSVPRPIPKVQTNTNCDGQANKSADCGYVYVIVEKNSLRVKM